MSDRDKQIGKLQRRVLYIYVNFQEGLHELMAVVSALEKLVDKPCDKTSDDAGGDG